MLNFSDLIGYIIAIISIVITIFISYKSKITKEKLDDLTKAIHDIAFYKLLEIKNVPTDFSGMARQRDSLASVLKAIQTSTKNASKTLFLQGEYTHGTEVGEIESSRNIKNIWLVSLDLRPDIEELDLQHSIANNLKRGKSYHYFFAKDFIDNINKLKEGILDHLNNSQKKNIEKRKSLSLIALDHKRYKHFLTGNSIAIYEFHSKGGNKGAQMDVVGFDEIVLPNERKGSLWQRQPDFRAKSILSELKSITKDSVVFGNNDKNECYIKKINSDAEEFYIVKEIRRNIFIKEQNVTEEEEYDGLDKDAIHLIGYFEEEPVATLRIINHGKSIQIGRVSVLLAYRGLGIGKKMMIEALNIINIESKGKEIYLESQLDKIHFYEKFGFIPVGENFYDARMPHKKMIKNK